MKDWKKGIAFENEDGYMLCAFCYLESGEDGSKLKEDEIIFEVIECECSACGHYHESETDNCCGQCHDMFQTEATYEAVEEDKAASAQ